MLFERYRRTARQAEEAREDLAGTPDEALALTGR